MNKKDKKGSKITYKEQLTADEIHQLFHPEEYLSEDELKEVEALAGKRETNTSEHHINHKLAKIYIKSYFNRLRLIQEKSHHSNQDKRNKLQLLKLLETAAVTLEIATKEDLQKIENKPNILKLLEEYANEEEQDESMDKNWDNEWDIDKIPDGEFTLERALKPVDPRYVDKYTPKGYKDEHKEFLSEHSTEELIKSYNDAIKARIDAAIELAATENHAKVLEKILEDRNVNTDGLKQNFQLSVEWAKDKIGTHMTSTQRNEIRAIYTKKIEEAPIDDIRDFTIT